MAEIIVVDADPALRDLLQEWLQPLGHRVREEGTRADLVVVDIPYPRNCGADVLQRVAREHPRAPRLVLSSGFFPGVDCGGGVARDLGVAGVLPKPLTQDRLVATVQQLLGGQ